MKTTPSMKSAKLASIKRDITRFDNACQDYAFKGSMHPSDWQAVEEEYAHSREALEKKIGGLL